MASSAELKTLVLDAPTEVCSEAVRGLQGPLVSILLNNYNYGRFLGQAIRSALAQSYANTEIIVVDDGSTDDSVEVARSFGYQVQVIAKGNSGQASAFNAGFAASRGEIVCLLDADDVFFPGKVERIVEVFAENPDAGWCFENLKLFRDSESERWPPEKWPRDRHFAAGKVDGRSAMRKGVFPRDIESASSGLSFRRELLARILPMPHARSILLCDDYIKTACYALAPGMALDEELSLQRMHGSNLYTNAGTRDRRISGQMSLLMGIYLQRRFRECRNAGMKLLCRGCAILTVFGGWQPAYREEAWNNLRMMGPGLALKCVVRTALLVVLEVLRLRRL